MLEMADPNQWTLVQLKEILREHERPTTGNKTELLTRLLQANPDGSWSVDYAARTKEEKQVRERERLASLRKNGGGPSHENGLSKSRTTMSLFSKTRR